MIRSIFIGCKYYSIYYRFALICPNNRIMVFNRFLQSFRRWILHFTHNVSVRLTVPREKPLVTIIIFHNANVFSDRNKMSVVNPIVFRSSAARNQKQINEMRIRFPHNSRCDAYTLRRGPRGSRNFCVYIILLAKSYNMKLPGKRLDPLMWFIRIGLIIGSCSGVTRNYNSIITVSNIPIN